SSIQRNHSNSSPASYNASWYFRKFPPTANTLPGWWLQALLLQHVCRLPWHTLPSEHANPKGWQYIQDQYLRGRTFLSRQKYFLSRNPVGGEGCLPMISLPY